MAKLPAAFTEKTRQLMGEERFERYLQSFEEDAPVSIRLNPMKAADMEVIDGECVPWCQEGYYLPKYSRRPQVNTSDAALGRSPLKCSGDE